ncbi:transcription factor GLABRA 3 isoform X2 [Neltuma alba]|uniref:transcription factor GLABRA 3 isoform X2 n=1 Tax=Neltuma alba TaxID=207710 RepID=UPI0010A4E9B2|nr:transcription factor GLABRA 3-like isoform X2 [Prosopis alba]
MVKGSKIKNQTSFFFFFFFFFAGFNFPHPEMVPANLKKQLALAVRSIQWSYAVYWSGSPNNPGAFEWGEGYYNGDIKTRKTSQAVELNSDQIGLRRSEQLRDLYESLATAESSPQAKRPSAALSPEDLTDTEWYYLVCMSFVFNIGQGLPGRTLAKGQPIWLYNAHLADSRIFGRSLLAKSASIQTVVCFPFLDGVLELGTTDLVSEDLSLIQRMRTSYLDILDAKARKDSVVAYNTGDGEEIAGAVLDHNAFDVKLTPESEYEVANATSPNNSSNEFQANQQADERFMVERINGVASHVQSWQVMEDELSNGAHTSMNTSDCISQTFAGSEKNASVPKGGHSEQDLQEGKNTKTTVVDVHSDEWHYQKILSSLFKSSDQLIMGAHFQNSHRESRFISWKKEGSMGCQWPGGATHQKILKKILFEVPRMHTEWLLESQEENDYKEGMRPEADEIGLNHVLSERKRRAKLNERFLTLKSMVPLITRDDKVSILDEAIEYLKKLEKKVRELEARRESKDSETRTKRTPQDVVERTCDNYCNNRSDNGKKPAMNKRKACDIDETEIDSVRLKDISNNVTICMNDNDVLVELKCPRREGVLLEIMEAVSNLHLDFHSVHSSEADGILHLTIKSKITGAAFTSAKKIKQALLKKIF